MDGSIVMRRTLAERELNRARGQLQQLSTLTDGELCASGLRNRAAATEQMDGIIRVAEERLRTLREVFDD
jgi:hypothetical protein